MKTPRLTIGMVVYNGEAHLAQAIQSFLDQTFSNFQLLVFDNASTDRTFEIASSFAQRDRRVSVVRNPQNIGALGNFIKAAEAANTPLFCWAAHDDLREPAFLETLIALLDANPDAALACCGTRIIDPDGTYRETQPELHTLRTTTGMTGAERLRMYLHRAPATPIYGVFRTAALADALNVFRDAAARQGPLLLWLDIVFLSKFISGHGMAVTHEPMFLFRRGGVSHRVDLYRSIGELICALRLFSRMLRSAIYDPRRTWREATGIRLAGFGYLCRCFLSATIRRMAWHHLGRTAVLSRLHARWMAQCMAPFRRLRQRVRTLPRGSRIVVFGAGKHTRRCIDVMRIAIGRHAEIVGVCDDAAPRCAPIGETPIIAPGQLAHVQPDVLLVSTDTYEAAMTRRAAEIAPRGTAVWCIYDPALEHCINDCSASSTSAMNASMASMAS